MVKIALLTVNPACVAVNIMPMTHGWITRLRRDKRCNLSVLYVGVASYGQQASAPIDFQQYFCQLTS